MKLSLKSRSSLEESIVLNTKDRLFTDMSQTRLRELHRQYDILCHCQSPQPVVMHIRYRSDTDLYFVADNPSSERHVDDCEFHSFRKQAHIEAALEDNILLPLSDFHPYLISAPPSQTSLQKKKSYRSPLPTILKTFASLCENSFANYSFGSFTSFKDFTTKIVNADKNKKIMTPWGKPITECIHYGPHGLVIAHKSVQGYADSANQIPTAIWFGYLPDTVITPGNVVVKGQQITYSKLHNPYNAKGPYLLFGFIPKPTGGGTSSIRDLLVIPIVASNYCLPIHSDAQREFALKYFPVLFGKNNRKDTKHYIKKPLMPIIEDGSLLYTDWLLTSKYIKNGIRHSNTVVVEHSNRHELMADIYGADVFTPAQIIAKQMNVICQET